VKGCGISIWSAGWDGRSKITVDVKIRGVKMLDLEDRPTSLA
jgi:hypothetical protein